VSALSWLVHRHLSRPILLLNEKWNSSCQEENSVHRTAIIRIILVIMLCIPGYVIADENTHISQGDQGYFSIHSIPASADVYFDGVFIGETPARVPVTTTGTQTHTIRMTMAGYDPWETTYTENPRAGQTITLSAALVPASTSGGILVTSSPSGAISTLDGSGAQTTPFTYTNVPAGTHGISVYLSGYQTYYGNVVVRGGETTEVFAGLSPVVTSGALAAGSDPAGAAVQVDGIYRGVTPTTVGNLAPGQHSVTLFKSGFQEWKGDVQVDKGVVTTISPTLVKDPQPVCGTVSITSIPAGADVYADGLYMGETRAGSPLVFREVKAGTHSLLLTRVGYQDYSTSGVIRAGENYDLVITLVAVPHQELGGVAIESSPSGAEVFLDNAYRGLAPLSVDTLPPGSYHVLLRLSGYEDWQSVVNVTPGQQVPLNAILTSLPLQEHRQAGILPYVIIGSLAVALALNLRKR